MTQYTHNLIYRLTVVRISFDVDVRESILISSLDIVVVYKKKSVWIEQNNDDSIVTNPCVN